MDRTQYATQIVEVIDAIVDLFHTERVTDQIVIDGIAGEIGKSGTEHWVSGEQLHRTAVAWAESYTGSFDFMRDMEYAVRRYGTLRTAQARGVLNCIRAEALRSPWTVGGVDTSYSVTSSATPAGNTAQHAPTSVPAPATEPKPAPAVAFTPPLGTFTVVHPDGQRTTLRIAEGWRDLEPGTLVAKYLNGPDNETAYSGFAFIRNGRAQVWKRFADNTKLREAVNTVLQGPDAIREAGMAYALESNRCWRCGRTLTVPASINAGLGPDCAAKVGI